MTRVRFTIAAEADILELHDYTVQSFGEDQWLTYEAVMRSAFDTLLSNPRIGANRDFVRRGARRYLVESHAIYYEIHEPDILVLRILGVRQDPGRHL